MKKILNNFSTSEIILITTMVAIDISHGIFLKPVMNSTGITNFIKIDMIIPLAIMFLTRKMIDKFGTLIIYEVLWCIASSFIIPFTFDTPGLLKLIPALLFGIVFELLYSFTPKTKSINLWISVIAGNFINKFILLGFKLIMGIPFINIIKAFFMVQLFTSIIVSIIAGFMTLLIYKKLNLNKSNSIYRKLNDFNN